MTGDTASVEDLRRELQVQLALIEHRALIVLVEASGTLDDALDDMLGELSAELGLPADAITRVEAEPSVLKALNHDRDGLMRQQRLIWLRARRPADVRTIRDHTPDLTAVVDLYQRLAPPPGTEEDWARCRDSIRALMLRQHGHLDVGLPGFRREVPVPIDKGYCRLVDWPVGERRVLLAGSPGSGKTTALRHLTWTYAADAGDPLGIGRRIPVLVSLRHYADDAIRQRLRSLGSFLVDWLRERGVVNVETLPSHTHRLLLLLDDLEELPGPTTSGEVLQSLASQFREACVVVAARPFGRHLSVGRWRGPWRTIAPACPSEEQARRILDVHGAQAQPLRMELASHDVLSPENLEALALVIPRSGTLPESRLALYRALDHRLEVASGGRPKVWSGKTSEGLDLVAFLAGAFRSQVGLVTDQWLEGFADGFAGMRLLFGATSSGDLQPVSLAAWFREACAHLVGDGRVYDFFSRGVVEYLAARSAVDGWFSNRYIREPAQGEVLVFALQMLAERKDPRLQALGRDIVERAALPSDDHLIRPLLALAAMPLDTWAWHPGRLHWLLAQTFLLSPAVGSTDPLTQCQWLVILHDSLEDGRSVHVSSMLQGWLVEHRDWVGSLRLADEDRDRSAWREEGVSTAVLRRLFGEIPPALGRLLALAGLPCEPLVTHLRARPEWWLRLLADWTEATCAAPEDEIVLPVPQWLKDEAAARSD